MSSTRTEWILELVDRVTAPLKNIDRFAKQSERSISAVDRLLVRINTKSQILSSRLTKMTIGAAAFGALTIGSLNFEEGMARANTMAELGTKQLALYSSQVRNISQLVPVVKTQLSEGLYNTISAGVPKENWITFLRDSSKAAIGGNAELGVVVDATSSTIKAYGDQWENASKIQDRFQKTVQLGQIPSLQSLASALPRVSAVSADLKVSQEELLSVFATASGVMGQPAEVATQLNAVLSAFSKPGAEAIDVAKRLGIEFNAKSLQKAGGLKNYIDVLIPRIQAFADKTGTTQQEIIGKLFGSQEAIKLVIGLGGTLAESFGENTQKLSNSTGAVQSAFDIMNATTKSKLQIFRNTVSNSLDGVVENLKPLFDGILKITTKVFAFANSFMKANPTLSRFIILGGGLVFTVTFIGTALALISLRLDAFYLKMVRAAAGSNTFTAAIGRAYVGTVNFGKSLFATGLNALKAGGRFILAGVKGLGTYMAQIITATAAQWGFNIALNANPIGLVVLAVTAAVGAIAIMIKYWDKIKATIVSFTKFVWSISPFKFLLDLTEKIFPGFKAKVEVVFNYVKGLVLGFWETIQKVWNSIKSFFGFGEKTSFELDVNTKPKGDPANPNPLTPDTSNLLITDGTGTKTNTNDAVQGISGSGSGKTITMNLDIKNYFNLKAGNWKDKADEVAEVVVGKIVDRMRDSVIALE